MSIFGSEADRSPTVFTSCGSDELLVLGAPASVSGRAPPVQRCNHQEVISHRELKTDFIRVLRSEALDDYICWIRTLHTEHTLSQPDPSDRTSGPPPNTSVTLGTSFLNLFLIRSICPWVSFGPGLTLFMGHL